MGNPKTLQNKPTLISGKIHSFIKQIEKKFKIPVYTIDERFTSKIAVKALVDANAKKSTRRDKSMIDKISAALILQSFVDRKNNL